MIKVTIYKNKHNEYVGFDTCDHAEYADPGEDIVCSAVSALVINAMNSIETFTEDDISCTTNVEEGKIEFRICSKPTHDAVLLLDSMVLGLQNIEDVKEYESYIDIIFKEV